MVDDAITEAHALYQGALDATSDQRRQIEQDLAFSDPSNPQQWDGDLKREREADPGGARPCLTFDQTGQYVQNVSGQVEQRPPSLHALPADGGADRKVAEQLDGFFRHVEHTSRAQQHYGRALMSAARAGVGYLIVRPEYVDRAMGWQEPRIGSEGDPLRVVFDPWSVELDGSDATFGFLLSPFSFREFERQWGKKTDKVSFADPGTTVRDERESVLVVEQWRVVDRTTNMVVHLGADGEETALPEDDYVLASERAGQQLPVLRVYKDKYRCVKWSKMSGAEVLVEETEYPASGIGLVPVYGYVGWSEGRMRYCGIPRRAMEPQRSYNYHMSEMRAYMAQAPKTPWLVPTRAVRGLETLWDLAAVQNRAWLPYHDRDPDGADIAAPTRAPIATNLQNHVQGAEQALRDVQAAIGMYQANLGAPSNETSGVAIDSRKEQGEAATANFPAHLAAGISQVGKLVMEMIPKLIDTKRQLRILGIDQTPGSVTIDPGQEAPMVETPQGLSINPNVGKYDVRVVVGASFSTQRAQAQAAFTEMMRAAPALMPAIAPLWAQTLDIPHADKLAQVLTAVAPPEVKGVLQPEADNKPNTAELIAKVQELSAALEEAIAHAKDAQGEADELRAGEEAKQAETAVKSRELDIKAYDSETKRLQVTGANEEQIKAIVGDLINTMLSQPEPLGDEPAQPTEAPSADEAPMPLDDGEVTEEIQ